MSIAKLTWKVRNARIDCNDRTGRNSTVDEQPATSVGDSGLSYSRDEVENFAKVIRLACCGDRIEGVVQDETGGMEKVVLDDSSLVR